MRFLSRPLWRKPSTIFWTAFILRLLVITLGHTYRFKSAEQSFGFGWETGRIARSIAVGEGFSSPFSAQYTGPTAWIAPIYPCILAAVFKIFGVYTLASSWVILAINGLFSALNAVTIFRIADRCFGGKSALWSAWIWALLPYAMYYAVHWPWETSLAALLLSCVFLVSLRMAGIGSPDESSGPDRSNWLLFGLLWGLIALTNPSLLSWLPFAGVWLLARQIRKIGAGRPLINAMLASLLFVVLVSPWTIRNYRVFHKFIPFRSNFGAELNMGNAEDAVGLWRAYTHPSQNVLQLRMYEEMGEIAYVHKRRDDAMTFIKANPGRFLILCVKRFIYFWFDTPMTNWGGHLRLYRNVLFFFTSVVAFGGLLVLVRRRHPARFLFGSLLLAVPLVYYIAFPHPRYRHPIEPQILILGVYLFQSAERKRRVTPTVPETALAR